MAPASLADASDPQLRLIMYLKVFRKVYGVGQRGVRIQHPICVVAKIRRVWPGETSAMFEFFKTKTPKIERFDFDPYMGYITI